MKTTRRIFIKNSVLMGTGIVASSPIVSALGSFDFKFNPRLGVCISLKSARVLSQMGYSYIEEGVRGFLVPDKGDEEFIKNLDLVKQAKLPVEVCNSFLPGSMKSVGPNAVSDELLKFAETAFSRAQQAGVEIIVFGSGGSRAIPEGFSREEARKQFIGLCKQMAPVAGKYKVTIVLEPLNSGECNFINSVAEGGEIVKEVGHPAFKLLADLYHMKVDEEGPENILKYGQLIRHVHIAEKEGRSAPGTNGEDFTPYFRALKEIRYKGRISIECKWQNMELQAINALGIIKGQLNK